MDCSRKFLSKMMCNYRFGIILTTKIMKIILVEGSRRKRVGAPCIRVDTSEEGRRGSG